MGVGAYLPSESLGKRAGPPVPLTPQPHSALQTQTALPRCAHLRSPHLCSASRWGDPCVPAGSPGRRRRTVRCWGSAFPRAPWSRQPWVPCTTTLSTGRAQRPSTPRGEPRPLNWVPEGREYKGIRGSCRETLKIKSPVNSHGSQTFVRHNF